jgi:hypothetical protein
VSAKATSSAAHTTHGKRNGKEPLVDTHGASASGAATVAAGAAAVSTEAYDSASRKLALATSQLNTGQAALRVALKGKGDATKGQTQFWYLALMH